MDGEKEKILNFIDNADSGGYYRRSGFRSDRRTMGIQHLSNLWTELF